MTGIYAGSFDPFTFGHMDIVEEALNFFDKVIVVCAVNAKKRPNFDRDKMVKAIQNTFYSHAIDHRVTVIKSDELIVSLCDKYGAKYIIRGLRNTTDYMYEEEIAKLNQRLNPNIKTVYFRAKDDTVSSSGVRELFSRNINVSEFVPPLVIEAMKNEQGC